MIEIFINVFIIPTIMNFKKFGIDHFLDITPIIPVVSPLKIILELL